MYRSIFVPLDGSPFGEHALPLALSLARRAGATLQLVHVHVPLAPLYTEYRANVENTLDPARRQRAQAYLEAVTKRVAGSSTRPVGSTCLEGAVAEALQRHATATGADLIVMTTHGRGPLARAWLGSVADDLVRRTTVPLLLVRPGETKADLGRDIRFQHLLVPLDGSPLAERILEPALAVATLMGAGVTLLRVLKPLLMSTDDPTSTTASLLGMSLLEQLQALFEQDRAEAQTYLEQIAERLRARSLKVQTRVAIHEQPAVAILEEMKAHPTDLVALETHGRGGLPRLLLGSVADKVLRGASVPLLVQRPPADQVGR